MEAIKKQDNILGIIISIIIHVGLLSMILLSKGCGKVQNPPQFAIEEIITLDFSEQGGGNPGSSSAKKPQPVEENPAPKQVTQEESPVSTPTSNSNDNNNESTASEEPAPQQPKNDLSDLFGHGSGDNPSGDGQGEGTGIGTGKGPNTGGGVGDGKGREVIGKPRMANPREWIGFVMVHFTIDADGNVISADVLFPHPQTTLTLTKVDQKFIEDDCKRKFKFTPTSSGYQKDRFVKKVTYITE